MTRTDLIAFRMSPAVVPEPYAAPGLTLNQVAHIVRMHWRRALLIAAAVLVLVGAVTLALPKTYTATATLMVNYEVNDPLGGKEFPTALLGSYMATQVELLQGPHVLFPVVDRLGLVDNWRYTRGYHGSPEGLREWIVRQLTQKLEVKEGLGGSQLIHISFSSSNAAEAARVANAIVDVYLEQATERMTGPAAEHARRYTQQLDELKKRVDAAQDELTRFRQQNDMIDDQGKSDTEAALLASLEEKLAEAQTQRRAAEARQSTSASVSGAVLGSNLVQSLKTQLAQQEARMAELRATMGPRHPQVLQLQSQMATTRSALAAEIGTYADSASSEVAAARQLESKLAAAVEQQRTKVLQVRRAQDQSAKLQLQLESAQAVYKRAMEGYDQVLAASSGQYTNTSIVNRALPPVKASKPKVLKSLAMGGVLGLLLGFGGTFAYELLLNRRVRCRDDFEHHYGIPVLVEFTSLPAIGSTV
jgi:uncharacterized protein involved in exopolysaccharide biosynthesis